VSYNKKKAKTIYTIKHPETFVSALLKMWNYRSCVTIIYNINSAFSSI